MKVLIFSFLFLFFVPTVFAQLAIPVDPSSNNTTINTCNGFIFGSQGSPSGGAYSNNEDVTFTICPGTPGDIVNVVFNFFQLSLVDDNPSPTATNVDYMDVFDGPTTASNTLGTYSGTQLQGVVIQATLLNPTGCLTFRFRSNTVGTGQFTGSATCATPCSDPVAGGIINGGITTDSIIICVGENVSFSNLGSFAQPGFSISQYEWDFMDGSTALGQNVNHSFDAPGRYLVQLFVTDNNTDQAPVTCVNNNLLDLQVIVSTIPTFVGFQSDTSLCLGESLTVIADPQSWEVTWNGFPNFNSTDDGCLPDTLLGVSQNIDLTQTGFVAGSTITNVSQLQSICIELEHSYMGDLVVILNCPNGQNAILHQQGGGGTQIGIPVQADNVDCSIPATQGVPFTYCFTPTATQTWVEWVAASGWGGTLPAGNYEPIQPLSNFIGCPLNGVWTITVIDNWAADDGTLFSFALNVDPALLQPVVPFTPNNGITSDSSYWTIPPGLNATLSSFDDIIAINPLVAGTYPLVYTMTNDYGCTYDTSFMLTVTTNPQVNAGLDQTLCDGVLTPINLLATAGGSAAPCNYTLDLDDSFGDGWNGNTVTVTIGGVPTVYTIATGSSNIIPLLINNGSTATFTFNAIGAWINECSYTVLNSTGATVLNNATQSTAPQTITANCAPILTYQWSPATGLNNPNIANPIANISGAQTYVVSGYPVGHPLCFTTDTMNINTLFTPFAGINTTLSLCAQAPPNNLFLLLGAGVATGGTWTGPGATPSTGIYNAATMNPGIYTYTVSSGTCVDNATVTVSEVLGDITNSLVTDVNCHASATGSIDITAINFSYYSLNGGPNINATSPFTVPNLLAGNHTITIANADGCTDNLAFIVNEPPALQIVTISPDTLICTSGTVTVSATGIGGSTPYIFTWTSNGVNVGTGQTLSFVPSSAVNNICVTLSEVCGSPTVDSCMTATQIVITDFSLVPSDSNGCAPFTTDLVLGNLPILLDTLIINYGDGNIEHYNTYEDTLTHTFVNAGVYTPIVYVQTQAGCNWTTSFANLITAYQVPIASFDINSTPVSNLDPVVFINNTSYGPVSIINWEIPGSDLPFSNQEALNIRYPEGVVNFYPITLTVTSPHGCIDSITRIVHVVEDVILYAPNTFTPDGDEFNQDWKISISGIDPYGFELKIFDRWGEQIYQTNDINVGWDGTYNGKLVQQGVYNWILNTKDKFNDKKYSFKGSINLIK